MTKKKKIIIGVCMFIAMLIAFIGGNALAKYQSQVRGSGKADIAKWVFEVNGNTSQMQRIALNKNYNPDTLTNGKIAPGTEGTLEINISTIGSEVGVTYAVDFLNETNKPNNLKFRYNGEVCNTLEELGEKITGTINTSVDNFMDQYKTIEIGWFWDYESGDDSADTTTGINDLDYTFDMRVTGTQVTPQENQ